MLQDIAPHIYHNPMSFVPPPRRSGPGLCRGQVLARLEEGLLQLPRVEQCTSASGWIYGFSIDETHYYLPQGPALQAPGFSMVSITGLSPRGKRSLPAPWESLASVCRKPVLRRLRQVSGAQHLGTGLGLPCLWPHCLP